MRLYAAHIAFSESMDKPGFSIGGLSQDERVSVRRLKKASYLAVAMSGLPPLATELRRSLVVRFADTVAKVFLRGGTQILATVGAAI